MKTNCVKNDIENTADTSQSKKDVSEMDANIDMKQVEVKMNKRKGKIAKIKYRMKTMLSSVIFVTSSVGEISH